MFILLTNYVYPLKEKIVLSDSLGFYLDNPRTKDEINMVAESLSESHKYRGLIPKMSVGEQQHNRSNIADLFKDIEEKCSIGDSYIPEFFELYDQSKPFEFLSHMCVIARYDLGQNTDEIIKEVKERNLYGDLGIYLLSDKYPELKNYQNLISYCFILAILMESNLSTYISPSLNPSLLRLSILANSSLMPLRPHQMDFFWQSIDPVFYVPTRFQIVKDELNNSSDELEQFFKTDESLINKIIYIGDILSAAYETSDMRVKILLLTGLVELLLARNPDTNKFNVEDSITKQFVLKSSIVINDEYDSWSITEIGKTLKQIYNIRSKIAHGDFEKLGQIISKMCTDLNADDEYIAYASIVNNLYAYIRAILKRYIHDKEYIDFIKKS